MRLLIRLMLCTTALIHQWAAAAEPNELEVDYREQPQQLYQQLNEALPPSHLFVSYEEYEQTISSAKLDADELFQSLYYLARLNLEVRVSQNMSHNEAKALRDTLQVIARTDYQRAAALNVEGRYAGLIEQHLSDTVSLNEQALNFIRNSHTPESLTLKFVIYDDMGVVNLMTKRPEAALNNFKQMRDVANSLRDPYLSAEAETRLAKYYRETDQLAKALQHYNEAYRYSAKHDSPYQKALLELSLAKLYRDMQQWDNALIHVHKSIELFRAQGIDKYLSSAMTVIAMVYAEQGEWNRAIDYYLNAQQFDAQNKSLIAQALNFHNLGEAYFHIENHAKAQEYLLQANRIFQDHKSRHYLVYNDLLVTQVALASKQTDMAQAYAQEALEFATQLGLKAEQVEALQYLVTIQEKVGDLTTAYATQKRIIDLKDQIQSEAKAEQKPNEDVALNEQNMMLKIQQQHGNLQKLQQSLLYRNIFAGLLLIALLATIVAIVLLRKQLQRDKQQCQALEHTSLLDPLFGLPGYRDFHRSVTVKSKGLLLLEYPELADMMLTRGYHSAKQLQQSLQQKLTYLLDTKVYSITPALFAVQTHREHSADELHQLLSTINIDSSPLKLNLALINLPLLADKEVLLPAEVLFETLQWLLAGARTVETTKGCYLALRVLEFTPSTVFSQPLYLQLGQSIRRGFIRIESNVDKELINWPEFQSVDTSDFTRAADL
ncbi:tetratricopeptide repeat protein [Shewanella sp.]|uniref:tetratricopeptide repeat protein n=1 Tax=Shewanella sp. TaxID=50422 RepID=UPI003A974318